MLFIFTHFIILTSSTVLLKSNLVELVTKFNQFVADITLSTLLKLIMELFILLSFSSILMHFTLSYLLLAFSIHKLFLKLSRSQKGLR